MQINTRKKTIRITKQEHRWLAEASAICRSIASNIRDAAANDQFNRAADTLDQAVIAYDPSNNLAPETAPLFDNDGESLAGSEQAKGRRQTAGAK